MFRRDLGTLIGSRLLELIREKYGTEAPVFAELPPQVEMGDMAYSCAMALARVAKKAPRVIAQELLESLPDEPLIARKEIAGPGYLNFYLNRTTYLEYLSGAVYSAGSRELKTVVEHTNINPNKAAHIGHLRNAILGDTLVSCLRYAGYRVEVQDYIDDTGVQVADVVAALLHFEERTFEQVLQQEQKIDHYAWDLYAKISLHYEENPDSLAWRAEVFEKIEEGGNPVALLAEKVASKMVKCHLKTMSRLGIYYDLLPKESDIVRLGFWEDAFARLKETGKVYFSESGDHTGCWVMDLSEAGEPDKILVRSNGTLTYVAKDIAYQMWKFGLLGKDFTYSIFATDDRGCPVWQTSPASEGDPPAFGSADQVFNVIDARQSYLQKVVRESLRVCGFEKEADRSIHFAYEMVALSKKCAGEMGIGGEGVQNISGRKGVGVKADDLLDVLDKRCRQEVQKRHEEIKSEELDRLSRQIMVAAVKFFNLKYGVNKVIAFDFDEALNFEGDSGPYLQYSVVRAKSILTKLGTERRACGLEDIRHDLVQKTTMDDDAWELVRLCGELPVAVESALNSLDISTLARYALDLSGRFHHFYHTSPLLKEKDEALYHMRLSILHLFIRVQTEALALMGIEIPDRM